MYPFANPFTYATGMYPFLKEKCVARLRRLVRREYQIEDVKQHTGAWSTGSRTGKSEITVRVPVL